MNPQQSAAHHFQIDGDLVGIEPYGTGHINDTYRVTFVQAHSEDQYILQRINTAIFRDAAALMHNIQRVTSHLSAKRVSDPQASRRTLTLIPARDLQAFYHDEQCNAWRAYRFIDNARTFDTVTSTEHAFRAARAFGEFQKMLVDLPAPRLHDTIPNFHNTPLRYQAFEQALSADVANRAALAKPEIEFALARQPVASMLLDAGLPERIIHNDTKFNNVLFDNDTSEALCVLDLDTVMPGLAPYDFGDMVRTATSPVDEDEQDIDKVTMQFPMFESLVRGYLSAASDFLTVQEKQHLVTGGKVITFEQGIRFLADYLNGDTYYKVHRTSQNLDRCRTQFRLIQSIEQQEDAMHGLVDSIAL